METLAPAAASSIAIARPIPRLPPLTKATFPPQLRSSMLSSDAPAARRAEPLIWRKPAGRSSGDTAPQSWRFGIQRTFRVLVGLTWNRT